MSSSHLCIYSDYNLVLAPLLEGQYLLHLPDLYHELAHPFLAERNADRPVLEPYREAHRKCLIAIKRHFSDQRHLALRQREADEVAVYLHLWEWLLAQLLARRVFLRCIRRSHLRPPPMVGLIFIWQRKRLAICTIRQSELAGTTLPTMRGFD